MIKNYKYSKTYGYFTKKIEDISLDEFITILLMRNKNNKIHYVSNSQLRAYCTFNSIPIKDEFLRIDIINSILENLSLEDKLDFCDSYGIGVTKYNFLAAGMTEQEYKETYRDFKVVAVEKIKTYIYKNLYSIRDYINYIEKKETEY